MAKRIMVQGTMSGVGKSLLTVALCRIFRQDGLRVAPFKSQNMALNSYVTLDGLEMGRAQAVQAKAAGIEPDVRMNPILLKPSSDIGSQLIVMGRVRGNYPASDYYKIKKTLIPEILDAYQGLEQKYDVIVIEGAGSPAEINLREDDIVNMGLAELLDSPVLLVGDIDRGGVFAQLYGTLNLLQPKERARIFGTVINKFRGDVEILRPGLSMLESKTGVPVLGVIPYVQIDIDDEDSLASRLEKKKDCKLIDIAVLRFPRISNFTDFSPLELHPAIGVRYVDCVDQMGQPDIIILPGTKSTMEDLLWMRQCGLESKVGQAVSRGTPILGICGGYQMLCQTLFDPKNVEHGGELAGMGLLNMETEFSPKKTRTRVNATVISGPFTGANVEGYEIHMGQTRGDERPFFLLSDGRTDGAFRGNVFGTYLHGLFDTGEMTEKLADWLLRRKELPSEQVYVSHYQDYQRNQYDVLAKTVRESLDLNAIYRAMEK